MSTRATYQIDFARFYIHHDGYPEGAAEYFARALDPANRGQDRAPNASLADDFMRANSRAELIEDHADHGDTEYRYTVRTRTVGGNQMTPTMHVMHRRPSGSCTGWTKIFDGTLAEFLESERIKE